jgi:hypothetical protein
MEKIFALATAVVIILACVAAFVVVPYVSVILLLLGVVTGAGISMSGKGSDHLFIVAIVLTLVAERLANVPEAGATLGPVFSHLGVIFGGIGMSTIGASATVIGMGMIRHLLNDWRSSPAVHHTTAAAE